MPVSGLLGLHAESMSAADLDALRLLAALPLNGQERVLLTAERFVRQVVPGISEQQRSSLLDRFGLQGVRMAIATIRLEPAVDLVALRERLLLASGVVPLRAVVTNRYANRSEALKASRALDVAHGVIQRGVGGKDAQREYERIEANAHEIAEISVLRKIARAHSRSAIPRSVTPATLATIEAALGADGIRLHERLRTADEGRDLASLATQRIDQIRSLLHAPAIPREWHGHIRVAVRSLEVAVYEATRAR